MYFSSSMKIHHTLYSEPGYTRSFKTSGSFIWQIYQCTEMTVACQFDYIPVILTAWKVQQIGNSRQEPFMTISHNLHVQSSILKWLTKKKSLCRELLFNVIVYLISCSNMAQAQAIFFVTGTATRHRQQVKCNKQAAYFWESNTLSHSHKWAPITSPCV